MNKKLKKICSITMTLAITAASAISMSVSADSKLCLSDYTIIDDKGMMAYTSENYKMIYEDQWKEIVIAESNPRIAQFVLSEDVNYEDVNDRIIEIFEEFYPDNYLDVSPEPTEGMPPTNETYPAYIEYVLNYSKNYKPNLWANTVDGVTTYTLCAINRQMPEIEGEKIAAVKKYSKAFMEKLNEEKLISAFYDFGEVYSASGPLCIDISYSLDINIDLIYDYIDEHNIDCTIKKDDYRYTLKFNDDISELERFLIAADIYEETSINVDRWSCYDISIIHGNLYGKNSLEEISDVTNSKEVKITGDANGDGELNIRDAAFIAIACAKGQYEDIPEWADYNGDGQRNIRDAAAIAIYLASK